MANDLEITVPIHWQQTKKKRVMVALNWYRNAHFMVLNNAKKHFNNLVSEQLNNEKFEAEVHVHYKVFVGRVNTDGGNIQSIIEKFVLDSLVKNKVIPDDTFDIVSSSSSEYHLDRKNPRVEITITDKTI